MSAGELRERVRFEARGLVDDGFGNEVSGDWANALGTTVFSARITPSRGAESIQAARLAGKQPVVITVRSSQQTRQVTVDWRVVDARSGTIYNIRSIVNPDERDVFLDMECDSGVAT